MIAVVTKCFLRTFNQFHYLEKSPHRCVEQPYLIYKELKYNLEFDSLYLLSFEATAKLRITPEIRPRNHNLPQKSNSIYSLPPSITKGRSELPQYQDSVFEFEYKARYDQKKDTMVDNNYEVVRRRAVIDPDLLLLPESSHRLSSEKIADLMILPSDTSRGYSIRNDYRDYEFHFEKQGLIDWTVRLTPIIRNYTNLPFNQGIDVKLGNPREELQLTHIAIHADLEPGVKWSTFTSAIPEYSNSIILLQENPDGKDCCRYVRMLKPQ